MAAITMMAASKQTQQLPAKIDSRYHDEAPAKINIINLMGLNPFGGEKQLAQSMDNLIRPTKKRYFILLMFIVLNIFKSFQWICLASMTNIVSNYYSVDNMAINWTCIIFMVTYIFLALPTTWIMDNIGIRRSMLIGSIGTTLGVVIKCFSCYPGGFVLSMIGHLLVGFSEPFYFSLYSRLAAIWFTDSEVSLATSLGLLGEQIGTALGFIIPGLLIGYDPLDTEAIGRGLLRMFLGIALVLIINTALIIIFFDDQPKFAPGIARFKQIQAEIIEANSRAHEKSQLNPTNKLCNEIREQLGVVREFIDNRDFRLLLVGFGINVGANISMHTLLNQMIVGSSDGHRTLGGDDDLSALVGRAGLILIVVGLAGAVICGHLLDKFHKYKATTLITYLCTFLSMALLTICLRLNQPWILYLAVLPLGFFISAYSCCGFEYAVEITYPKPELVSSTLLNISAQVFGIPISLAGSAIVDAYGSQAVGIFLCAMFLIGLFLTCFQSGDLKRQRAVGSKGSGMDVIAKS